MAMLDRDQRANSVARTAKWRSRCFRPDRAAEIPQTHGNDHYGSAKSFGDNFFWEREICAQVVE
jgi:hypothetical protein